MFDDPTPNEPISSQHSVLMTVREFGLVRKLAQKEFGDDTQASLDKVVTALFRQSFPR